MAGPSDPRQQAQVRTVSSVDASQFVTSVPGQPGTKNVLVPGQQASLTDSLTNFRNQLATSNTDGNTAANEFDQTAGFHNVGRIPTIITTEQRMAGGLALAGSAGSDPNATPAQNQATNRNARLGWTTAGPGSTPQLIDGFGRRRNPFTSIVLNINPGRVSIRQGLRAVESKNKSGTVMYTWRDARRKTFFDEPVVTIQFRTGNLLPFTYIGNLQKQGPLTGDDFAKQPIPTGLANYYRFMEVLDDQKILPDGRPNFVYITHSSRKYPRLTLIGFFDPEGVTIEDDAESPNELIWSATLNCRFTYPQLSDSTQLLQIYQEEKLAGPAVPAQTP